MVEASPLLAWILAPLELRHHFRPPLLGVLLILQLTLIEQTQAQVVQSQSGQPLHTDNENTFVDASDGSDIEEFTESFLSSSQTISEFSQNQSILLSAQDVQNASVVHETVANPLSLLWSMWIPWILLWPISNGGLIPPRRHSPGSRSKHRRVLPASPRGRGRYCGLPAVVRDRPSKA